MTGLAWELLGEQHMPQRMQDERRAAAMSEEEALELDVDPDEAESDDESDDEDYLGAPVGLAEQNQWNAREVEF